MKTHVVDELKSAGMSGQEAEHAFDQVSKAMARVLERGARVKLDGIGLLYRKTTAETRRRNPRTGESIVISPYERVALRNPRRF